MINQVNILGIILIILCLGLILAFAFIKKLSQITRLRDITAFKHLKQAIGLTVEDGKCLHISLGQADLLDTTNASAFIGLSTLERLSQLALISDKPPIATSGSGALSILSQDTLKYTYRKGNLSDQYQSERAYMTGVSPFSYAIGAVPIIKNEQVHTSLLIGNFGPEVALLTEAGDRQNAFTLAASDSLTGQAVLYAAAKEPLIGEELFAVPAYLNAGKFHQASLRAQDILRWVLIIAILVGAILKFLGISLI
ncbi:MAG: hypothetical protein JEZ06_10105 [Anaerolineaceae bacterium]|nr:hypothetical protein [Anaerolineaceae bacterium]